MIISYAWIILVFVCRVESIVPKGCDDNFDLAILVDSSESVLDPDPLDQPLYTWNEIKTFTRNLIQDLPLDTNARAAFVHFGSSAEVLFNVHSGYTSIQMQDLIRDLHHSGGNTNTGSAFSVARSQVFTMSQSSDNSKRKIVIIITDGLSNIATDRTFDEIERIKTEHVEIYCVSISKEIDEEEIRNMVSNPADKHHLKVDDVNELQSILDDLVYGICKVDEPEEPPESECIEDCLTCSDSVSCIECRDGMYFDGVKCNNCMENCEQCRSYDSCDLCNVGWYWDIELDACEECQVQADLALLIDVSGSIRDKNPDDGSYDNFQLLKDFIKNLLGRLDLGPDTTRVAAVRFSTAANLMFHLDKYNTPNGVLNAIQNMPYGGGQTNTSGALHRVRTDIFHPDHGDRQDVRNIVVMITDGESTKPNDTKIEAQMAHDTDITMFVVGVTDDINEEELRFIATDPDETHYFNSTAIRFLDNILLQLVKHVCAPENPNTGRSKRDIYLDIVNQDKGHEQLHRQDITINKFDKVQNMVEFDVNLDLHIKNTEFKGNTDLSRSKRIYDDNSQKRTIS